jgi:hypothetical protein
MKITFDQPITIGDLEHRHTIASMEVVTIAFNLAPGSGDGHMNVSVTLRDPDTGFQQHFMYEDATLTRLFWQQVKELQLGGQKWLAPLLNRLISDGKLPAGKFA